MNKSKNQEITVAAINEDNEEFSSSGSSYDEEDNEGQISMTFDKETGIVEQDGMRMKLLPGHKDPGTRFNRSFNSQATSGNRKRTKDFTTNQSR